MESSAEEQENSWITNFCAARGNEFFCQVGPFSLKKKKKKNE